MTAVLAHHHEAQVLAGNDCAGPLLRAQDVKQTIWLTRPDLRKLCRGDRAELTCPC